MKHHPDLFNARSMHHDTKLLFKLKLLLGSICAYGGEIPLSISEIAKRMNTSTYRVRVLCQRLVEEGLLSIDVDGKMFFNKYVFVQENSPEPNQDKLYAKNFKFFHCDEFLNQERNVQRLILHFVGKQLVYLPGNFAWGKTRELYGEGGLLQLRNRKEALRVIEKAKQFLKIKVSKNEESFQVTGVHQKWLDMGEINSEGSVLWVKKRLDDHNFCVEFISEQAVWQLAKVMEDYYAKYEYEYAARIFDAALSSIMRNQPLTFFQMIYKDNYIVNKEMNELDEISAYFRAVMESAELEYAEELAMEIETLRRTKRNAELQLFKGDQLVKENNRLINQANSKIKDAENKLSLLQKHWLRRIKHSPGWFLKNKARIDRLPPPILEIKKAIELEQQKTTRTA